MIISYQLFEIDNEGSLVESRDESNEILEFITEQEAMDAAQHSMELKEYVVLKKIRRESNILDDIDG